MAEWVPPKGYRLCPDGTCGDAKPTGAAKEVAEWTCDESDACKPKGEHKCGCYLVEVRPRSHHVTILAEPGKKWTWERRPPGWGTMCLCLHEDPTAPEPPAENLGWVAPAGHTISTRCGDCGVPTYVPGPNGGKWSCFNDKADANPGCYLVEVPRNGKQLHILAGPGHDIHESHLHHDWDVFCICLSKP